MSKGEQFDLTPKTVPQVHTKYRTIQTQIPNPESVAVIERLRKYEPRSMSGQPPVVWDRAQGINVYDAEGNKWIDFSSCVVVANAGHCNPDVQKAILDMVQHGLLNNYVFPSDIRSRLVEKNRVSGAGRTRQGLPSDNGRRIYGVRHQACQNLYAPSES